MEEVMTYEEFAATIKAKYPQYQDVDDLTLATKMIEKYPQYADRVSLEKKNQVETVTMESASEDGSSESKSTDDRNFLEKYVDWWKESWGLDEKPIEERGETRKSLESGMARMVGGLVGIPDKLAKADLAIKMELAKAFGSDEVKQKVQEIQDKINSLPEDKRTSVKLKLQAQTVPAKELFGIDISPINQWFADRADEIKDDQESIDAARKQYETNIINDIGSGKIGQASERIFNGIVESIPMMAATVGTGGTGLAVVGGSVASDKMEELEREGEVSDIGMVGVGALRGGFEALGGKVLQGIFKAMMGKVSQEAAEEITQSVFSRLKNAVINFGKEFREEAIQSAQEEITDALVKGEKIDWEKVAKNMVDGGLIGGFSTAPSNIIPSQRPIQQGEAAPEGGQVELNIPAVETVEELQTQLDYIKSKKEINPEIKAKLVRELTDKINSLKKGTDNQDVVIDENAVDETDQAVETDTEATGKYKGKSVGEIIKSQDDALAEQSQEVSTEVREVEDTGNADKFEQTANDARNISKDAQQTDRKSFINNLRRTFTTRRPEIEQFFRRLGMNESRDAMDAVAGFKSATSLELEENNEITKNLNDKDVVMTSKDSKGGKVPLTERDIFDNVIKARAILGIEQRAKANPERYGHLDDVVHMGGLTPADARAYLNKLRETNESVFEKVMDASWQYEMRFQKQLDESLSEGLISQKQYDDLKDNFYSPRKVLNYLIEDIDSDISTMRDDQLSRQVKQTLGNFQKKIKKGSKKLDEMDAMYLLNLYTAAQQSRIFQNRSHRTFANEFKRIKTNFDNLTPRQKKIFGEFEKNVIFDKRDPDNPVTESGKPKYIMKKAPLGYSPVYYYENGQQNRFFMKDFLYEQFTDTMNKPQVNNVVKWLTGSTPVKLMATGVNLAFMYANIPMEFVHAMNHSSVYSNFIAKGGSQLMADYALGMHDSMTKSQTYKDFIKAGGGQLFKTMEARRIIAKKNAASVLKNNAVSKWKSTMLRQALDKIFDLQKATEEGIRIGIYRRRMKQLVDGYLKDNKLPVKKGESGIPKEVLEAMRRDAVARSREIADFNRGSIMMKQVEGFIPYANITAQATDAVIKSFKERPVGTTLRHIQTAGMSTAVFGAIGYILVMANMDDEDKKAGKSVEDVMIETYNQQSRYTQDKYWIVPTGWKSENGNYVAMPIRKVESISFLTNYVEEMFLRNLAKQSNTAYVQRDYWDLLSNSALENFAPIPVKPYLSDQPIEKNVVKIVSAIPAFSSAAALMGINAYTGGKIDYSNDPEYLEGRGSDRIEPFFKDLGDITTGSPARLQKAVESYITTPNTNPYIGGAYEILNLMSSYQKNEDKPKDILDAGMKVIEGLGKGFKRRVIKEGFEYNTLQKLDKAVSREDIDAEKAAYDFEATVKGEYIRYLENPENPTAKLEEIINDAADKYKSAVPEMDTDMIGGMVEKALNQVKNKKTYSPIVWKIMFQPSERLRAKKLYEMFGDNITDKKFEQWIKVDTNKKVWDELIESRAVNDNVMKLYDNLLSE